jgi:hypothetical protein
MREAIEVLDAYQCGTDALQSFDFQKAQDGYLGGRILPPSNIYPRYRVQTFHKVDGETDWLPDGMRRVWMTHGLMHECGITECDCSWCQPNAR